jgi:hypothetical protein
MWLRAVHRHFLSRGVAALLAVLVCGGTLDWGHAGGDDRDCDVVVVHHDHAAHRLSTTPAASTSNDHCYICHSLRLLHQAVTTRYERVVGGVRRVQRLDADVLALRDALRVGLSSRAPPSIGL